MKREQLEFGIAQASCKRALGREAVLQVLWKGLPERVTVPWQHFCSVWRAVESGCLGMQSKEGGTCHPRLNNGKRPIANKYREGKMKRTLKRG